jgi:hypothetical protein
MVDFHDSPFDVIEIDEPLRIMATVLVAGEPSTFTVEKADELFVGWNRTNTKIGGKRGDRTRVHMVFETNTVSVALPEMQKIRQDFEDNYVGLERLEVGTNQAFDELE